MNFFHAVNASVSAPVAPSGIVTSGLIWHIDPTDSASYPGSGSTIYDLVGSNNGAFEGGVYVDANGHLILDGVNDAINFGNIATSNSIALGAGSFTIQAWGYSANSGNSLQAIYSQTALSGDPSNRVLMFVFLPQTRFIASFWTPTGSNQQTANYGSHNTANAWRLYTMRYDSSANEITIFVDTSSDPPLTGVVNTGLVTRNFRIGAFGTSFSTYEWYGRFGAFMQYNRALSAAEIAQNYNATKADYGL